MPLRTALICCAAFALQACSTVPPAPDIEAGPQPDKAQAEAAIRANLKRTLRDPDSMKDFSMVSGPDLMTGTTAGGSRERAWLFCVEYNAKNAYGGYTGLQAHSFPLRFSGADVVVISRINWIGADRGC